MWIYIVILLALVSGMGIFGSKRQQRKQNESDHLLRKAVDRPSKFDGLPSTLQKGVDLRKPMRGDRQLSKAQNETPLPAQANMQATIRDPYQDYVESIPSLLLISNIPDDPAPSICEIDFHDTMEIEPTPPMLTPSAPETDKQTEQTTGPSSSAKLYEIPEGAVFYPDGWDCWIRFQQRTDR